MKIQAFELFLETAFKQHLNELSLFQDAWVQGWVPELGKPKQRPMLATGRSIGGIFLH